MGAQFLTLVGELAGEAGCQPEPVQSGTGQHHYEVSHATVAASWRPSCASCLLVKRGVLPVVASVVSGRPVGESSQTFASRGRLATPSGTSRPRCSDGGRVVAAVVGARVRVGAGRGGRRLRGPLLRLCTSL